MVTNSWMWFHELARRILFRGGRQGSVNSLLCCSELPTPLLSTTPPHTHRNVCFSLPHVDPFFSGAGGSPDALLCCERLPSDAWRLGGIVEPEHAWGVLSTESAGEL